LLQPSREKRRDYKAILSAHLFINHDQIFIGLHFSRRQKLTGLGFIDCIRVLYGL